MKVRVGDLIAWPPEHGDTRGRGQSSPPGLDQVIIEQVLHVGDDHVICTCGFDHQSTRYSFQFPSGNGTTSRNLAKIVEDNKGQPMLSIYNIPIEAEGEMIAS
jgi:hypothetical protein